MTAGAGQVLLSTDALAARLGDPRVRILEVDEDTTAYGRGHIPGAQGVHWQHDLQDPIRREFIGAERFAALMDRLGITNDTPVVLYGGNNNWFAAYAYWYLKYYGHQPVKLLDGGRKSWELEGHPLTEEVPQPAPTAGYRVKRPVDEIRALRGQVEGVLDDRGVGLVDVRSPEEYRGEKLAPDHLPQAAGRSHTGRQARQANLPRGAGLSRGLTLALLRWSGRFMEAHRDGRPGSVFALARRDDG